MKRIKYFLMVGIILGIVGGVFAQQPPQDKANEAKKAYNEGLAALRSGQLDPALEKFKKAVELDPKLAVAHYAMGIVYKRKRDHPSAEKAYQDAIKADPTYAKAYIALGLLQTSMNKYDEAINTYKAALNNDPKEKKAYWGIGFIYLKKKN